MLLAARLTALFGLTAQVIHGSAASVRLLRRLKLTRLVATRRQVQASCEGEVPAAFDSRVGQIEGEAQRRDGRGAPRLCDGGDGVPSAGTVRSLRCAPRLRLPALLPPPRVQSLEGRLARGLKLTRFARVDLVGVAQ